jgi:formate/nitrite transporter FocA (FNT family)
MDRTRKPGSYSNAPPYKYRGSRHGSSSLLQEIYATGSRQFTKITGTEIFLLAVLGGAFMTIASLLAILFMTGITAPGIRYLLSGLGLSVGFILVILTNSVLVTEANVFVPNNFYNDTIMKAWSRLLRFWGLAWVGNIVGAIIVSCLIYFSRIHVDVSFSDNLTNLVADEVAHVSAHKFRGIHELILSGLLANWIVALTSFFAQASRNFINQFVIVFLAFITITATGFEYFPVNTGLFSLNAFMGKSPGLLDIFVLNLIPVTIGNILGGAILVGAPLLFMHKKKLSNLGE